MNYQQFGVLYVDDEPANLTAFSYCFEDLFHILTATSGEEALALLRNEPVALLLADQRMPGMTGVQLCALAREKHPDVVRMIVTAYSDIAEAVAAINTGQVARYILKPWREEAMAEILRAGVEAYQLGTLVHDLQIRLLKSEQQSTTTFLIGRVLHELSNPAASISTNVRFMQDSFYRLREIAPAGSEEFRTLLQSFSEALNDSAEGCRELALRLERFRDGQPAVVRVSAGADLARVVDAAVAIVRSLIHPRARLMVEHAAAPATAESPMSAPVVAMDRTHLSQVLVNLLMNAAEAIEPGHPEENRILIRTFAKNGNGCFEVEDTGRGIAAELLDQVFEPHFTSKPAPGHGLGLSIVRELVTSVRGSVGVRSELGRGTTFTVEIPLAPRS
jgi:signal transduction histidine kinase